MCTYHTTDAKVQVPSAEIPQLSKLVYVGPGWCNITVTVISSKSSGWHNSHVNVLKSASSDKVCQLFLFANVSSPGYNRTGWLGIKHQVTYSNTSFLLPKQILPVYLEHDSLSLTVCSVSCWCPGECGGIVGPPVLVKCQTEGRGWCWKPWPFLHNFFHNLNLGQSFSSWVTSLAVVLDFSVSAALTLYPRRDVWLVPLTNRMFLTGCHSLQTGTLWFSFLVTLWFACYRLWELYSSCCASLSQP